MSAMYFKKLKGSYMHVHGSTTHACMNIIEKYYHMAGIFARIFLLKNFANIRHLADFTLMIGQALCY